jgi:hypothetical protein
LISGAALDAMSLSLLSIIVDKQALCFFRRHHRRRLGDRPPFDLLHDLSFTGTILCVAKARISSTFRGYLALELLWIFSDVLLHKFHLLTSKLNSVTLMVVNEVVEMCVDRCIDRIIDVLHYWLSELSMLTSPATEIDESLILSLPPKSRSHDYV